MFEPNDHHASLINALVKHEMMPRGIRCHRYKKMSSCVALLASEKKKKKLDSKKQDHNGHLSIMFKGHTVDGRNPAPPAMYKTL